MLEIEPKVRAFCAAALDPFVGAGGFDFVADLGAQIPSGGRPIRPDDLMTDLLYAEFEDETGTTRRLTCDEVLMYVSVVSGAGNETTNRLIGWMGKVLADHPDQRRELVDGRSLVANAIEELLRFEPPTPHVARYVTPRRRAARRDRPGLGRAPSAGRRPTSIETWSCAQAVSS